MQPFQFIVIKHPTPAEQKKGKIPEVVVKMQTVIAKDKDAAMMDAARAIPEKDMKDKNRLEIFIRPF